jgi:hypothetical protein
MLLLFRLSERGLPPMSRFPQPCAECGALTSGGSRCDNHERDYRARRNARAGDRADRRAHKSQLYNHAYRQEAKRIRETATHCHICRQAFVEGDKIEADHLLAGVADSPLAPAHRRCNQSRGDKPIV